jgi:alpha-1,2-mannosyltransferase
VSSVLERRESATPRDEIVRSRLLPVGGTAFAVVLAGWLAYASAHLAAYTVDPADLRVYVNGGLIVRHVSPPYSPGFRDPLYDWPLSKVALKFTYTPFAAVFFAVVSYVPWPVLPRLSQVVNLLLLVAAAWFTMDGLSSGSTRGPRALPRRTRPVASGAVAADGQPGSASRGPSPEPGGRAGLPHPGPDWRVKLGGALLAAAVGLLTEPVFRTLYLGQVNVFLMALIIADLRRPGDRRLKGAATGIAAGIKLVPLVFIPYLLLTRRFRAAAMAAGTFAATVALGFIVIPGDSGDWWLNGLFFSDGRTGFAGWGGNQSLRGLLTRLAGSLNAGSFWWWFAAVGAAVIGLSAAVVLDRAGHSMLAILATALVGLLDSPISWDHHWVWVVPGIMAAAWYAWQARRDGRRGAARWCAALAAALLLIFAAWPGALWSVPITGAGDFTNGLIWAGPNSKVTTFMLFGDNPAYLEYHWRGLQNVSGNAFVLTGAALLILLAVVALRTRRRPASGARRA